MSTNTKIQESAAAGKAGEPTAAKSTITLSASGVADLLKSEFATDASTETPPAKEIPAAGESDVEDPETVLEEGQPAEAEVVPDKEEEVEQAEEETEGEEQEATTEEATAEETPLPESAQAELAAWEETGGPLPKALQALVDKRIGKLTGAARTEKERADQAEAALTAIKAEAEALRNDPKRPAYLTPQTIAPEAQLEKLTVTAKAFVTAAENYLDDTATDEERTKVEKYLESERLDAKGLKRRLRDTQEFLTQELPAQRQQVQAFRATEAKCAPVAKAYFPFLGDKAHPDYAAAQQVLALIPELTARTPAHGTAVGTYVLGNKIIAHLQAAGVQKDFVPAVMGALAKAFPVAGKAAPAKAKTPPPRTPSGNTAAATKGKVSAAEVASQKFNKNPNRETATQMARMALMGP